MMKTIILTAAAALVMTGCGNLDTGDTYQSTSNTSNTTVGDNSTYTVIDSDGNVSVEYAGAVVPVDKDGDETVTVGEFPGEDASQAQCNAAGYFWCGIKKECTRTPLDDSGSGSCN